MLPPIIVDDVRPRTPAGLPAKAAVGERVPVGADIFRDGHDLLAARVRWRAVGESAWFTAPLTLANPGVDRWTGSLVVDGIGRHEFQIEAWTDRFATWRHHAEVKAAANDPELDVVLEEGALLLDRLTPRAPKEVRPTLATAANGLRDATRTLDERLTAGLDEHVAALLADVADPLDRTRTKSFAAVGRSRARSLRRVVRAVPAERRRLRRSHEATAGHRRHGLRHRVPAADPSHRSHVPQGPQQHAGRRPRRSGQPVGDRRRGGRPHGHPPGLGTIEDFDAFVAEARALGIEVALDYALQCSPDHPWVREHPEWFHHRPDGSIKYAENPPKKYQDIYPINFWPEKDTRSRGAVGGVQGDPRLLDRARREDLPRRQPAHQAVRVLGVDHPRRAGRPPRRRLPRRGVHPARR